MKLAENLSSIVKKLEEVNDTTQKLGEIIENSDTENETPHLAIENTQNELPIENNIEPGVKYHTSLENTLTNMKTANHFLLK